MENKKGGKCNRRGGEQIPNQPDFFVSSSSFALYFDFGFIFRSL